MAVIAKTKLLLSLREFWLMTPKEFYEILKAYTKLNALGNNLPVGQRKQGNDIILDELPVGMEFL
jgi:hypothetical protein